MCSGLLIGLLCPIIYFMTHRIMMKDLIAKACDVLGNKEAAKEWLKKPHLALAGSFGSCQDAVRAPGSA
jgi:hypothetical protein